MKFLTDRREIAQAINIDRLPVITIDITKPMDGYPDCYSGSKVLLATPCKRYPDMYSKCTVKMFGDEPGNAENHDKPWAYRKIVLTEGMVGIFAEFGMHDLRDMIEWSNCRYLTAGQRVVVFFDRGKDGFLRLMKVSDRVTSGYSTVATLEDID